MNTLEQGQFRYIIFKEKEQWLGTALEFNITVEGDDPRVVEAELHEAVIGYLESAKKMRTRNVRSLQIDPLLNQDSDPEYERRWEIAQESLKGNVPSPLSSDIYKFGVANLALA